MIEAYRKFHHGESPTPAWVKQILTSTATDLGVPAQEQGAGLLNSYKAVLMAESIGSHAAPLGQSLLLSQNQLYAVGNPGSVQKWPVTVSNTGSLPQAVRVSGRTFGPGENVQKGSITLTDGTSPEFANYQGLQNNYGVFRFPVPRGADRLNAAIAYPLPPVPAVTRVFGLFSSTQRAAWLRIRCRRVSAISAKWMFVSRPPPIGLESFSAT